ncbi:thiamine phosphate synthase [Candidatus Pelagibacter sp.]|nr:thiamine phosphate synthase [Candidatus Pelagibacter sp.]
MDNNTGVIYRNYKDKFEIQEIIRIKKYCNLKRIKFFLSNNYKIALKLGLDGAYIPSFNNDFKHLSFITKSSFLILGSAHNVKEIRLKEKQNVKLIFISTVFKKNKNYLGINRFKFLKNQTKKKVIALGGISKNNEKKISLLKCFGFSGISYFE